MAICNKAKDRDSNGRLIRKYRGPYSATMSTPMYWVHQNMIRPRRRENKYYCKLVTKGMATEDIVWPLGNCKPHLYYW